MTGHGGWPLNVFLTPDQEPFFGGTYWPPEPRHGMPSFRQVLEAVAGLWRERRERGRRRPARALDRAPRRRGRARARRRSRSTRDLLDARASRGSLEQLRPPPRRLRRRAEVPAALRARAARRASASARCSTATLRAMALGGICDQVGGGFARYAVDATWTVPHFEKMLYDNALLARALPARLAGRRRAAVRAHLPRDARLLPARARGARRRLLLLARRRLRGRRGPLLRLDAGRARGRARRRSRRRRSPTSARATRGNFEGANVLEARRAASRRSARRSARCCCAARERAASRPAARRQARGVAGTR